MSCFKLPEVLCDELHSLCANFWWGSSRVRKAIHWVSWDKLCVSKALGGMGFRNLKMFNQAMLAKVGWRIIDNPGSLLSRVLKGKYFPNCDFLDAGVKRSGSFVWRSLRWGRVFLARGIR